ncbi:DNA methyltransferase [uncultured Draconibacterium sp.]|uniref:class I SAM-dependent DNA methyltransferase n=1 Tax=uncultured Draconibacterium sp. TaxID=1573823 RepID=UPI0029C603B0|nr:DNA methyltransferase [uncultured Draconibacterium sp.]
MNITQIEQNTQNLMKSFSKENFIFDLLLAYGTPNASIARLKNGNMNMSKVAGEVSIKKKLFYKQDYSLDLNATLANMVATVKHKPRFVVTTDFKVLLAFDTKTFDKLDIDFNELPKHFDFFLPLAGIEKAQQRDENIADVKAAEKMAKLFDTIKRDNPDDSPEFIHNLNVFLSRLLFCFFAEDTGIFKENQFTNALASHTVIDGGDLKYWLNTFFKVLNTAEKNRDKNIPSYLNDFPYVNGGLFRHDIKAPNFSRRSRQAIIDCGIMRWAEINPDIFGSMFQAVIGADQRGSLGQHYTSVPNIMKVIEPLFLNELYEVFENNKYEPRKLKELLHRLSQIKIFDPACGSGNFLIIAYKELRKLEIKIIKQLLELQKIASGFRAKEEQLELIPKTQLSLAASYQVELFSHISVAQFYGIEIDDFAHEVAMLALWLTEHQMNMEFFSEFGQTNPTLPLQELNNIVQGNACRLNWENVCPKKEGDEIYILGNPPYLGARMQEGKHKADMDYVLSSFQNYRDLDYIACWFYKGAQYIRGINSKLSFVSTNSICQGLQVGLLWPNVFNLGIEICFAHLPFKWTNNAKSKAAVIVSVVGLSNANTSQKVIFENGLAKRVKFINAYLSDGANTIIERRSKPLSSFNKMSFGNMPNDGGGLILTPKEKNELLKQNPEAHVFVKRLLGASEFIRGNERFCLWISDDDLEQANAIPFITERIELTKAHRLKSKDSGTNDLAKRSHQFRDRNVPKSTQIIVPSVSSERREYIPVGFLNTDTVISNSAQAIYDPESYILGVLSSKMHMIWMRTVGGKLKSDYRYAKDIIYNTFPFPYISDQRKEEITHCVLRILEERENHSGKTPAQWYDPDKMPDGLREAHRLNDLAVERCYRSKPFESDEERLEYLFKLYEKMIADEKAKEAELKSKKNTRKIKE